MNYAREVTIVVLIILAGITLNAVIGENGIIFQSKETKNMIANETEYDNQQLAQLQNELKDNELYSGIGIIPGTDIGGSSEGGEQGNGQTPGGNTGGGTNTGGNPSSPDLNTGGGGQVSGTTAKDPTIYVLSGEEIAASVYRSDVTLQIATPEDRTQKIKYILRTTDTSIESVLYPNGLVKELDIENGGTLTLTAETEYTLTAYAYDAAGNKSNPTAIWLKIQKSGEGLGTGITVELTSGIEGKNGWYTSNLTYRVLGQDKGSNKVTYRVTGIAKSNGMIGNLERKIGEEVDTGEVTISNGTTFKIAIDGEFEIRAYTYNGETRLSELTTPVQVKRDASKPIIVRYTGNQEIKENVSESGFLITLATQDLASKLANEKTYTYNYKLSTVMDYRGEDADVITANSSIDTTTKLYPGLEKDKTYDMYAIVRDQAGNIASSDIIARPAIWVSSNPSVGEKENEGKEGARVYYKSSDVDVTVKGQDVNSIDKQNAKVGKVTYQIIGTTTGEGQIDEKDGKSITDAEQVIKDGTTEETTQPEKTIQFRADGKWEIKIHNYNASGTNIVSTNTIRIARDTVKPNPPTFTASAVTEGDEGQEGHFKGNIRITAHGSDDTSFKKITYQISGASTQGYTDIQDGQSFDLPAVDGTYIISGYTHDYATWQSDQSQILTVVRDTKAPNANAPTVSTANNADKGEVDGTTSYFKGVVKVQLNGGSDENGIVDRATVEVTGTATKAGKIDNEDIAQNKTVNKIIETTKNGTFDITADGRWTIKVYTYDRAGNRSQANTITVVKDTVGPNIKSFTAPESTIKPKYFTVQVDAEDPLAGLATTGTYTYSIITSPATADDVSTSNTHKYDQNLSIDTDYVVKVIVKDRAGNTTTSDTLTVHTLNGYYLKEKAKIGDIVDVDLGRWKSSSTEPTGSGEYGGQTEGNLINTALSGDSGWVITKMDDEYITVATKNPSIHLAMHGSGASSLELASQTIRSLSTNSNISATVSTSGAGDDKFWLFSWGSWTAYSLTNTGVKCSGCGKFATTPPMTHYYSNTFSGSKTFPGSSTSYNGYTASGTVVFQCSWCQQSLSTTRYNYTYESTPYYRGVAGVRIESDIKADTLTSGDLTSKYRKLRRMGSYLSGVVLNRR